MTWRHEWKHEINVSDLLQLRQRLRAVMQTDSHAVDGKYEIRSLYLDTHGDKALREKIDGVDRREKFRLRYYNGDTSRIRLEKKCRRNGLGKKQSVPMTEDEVRAILENQYRWMMESGRPLVEELYCKMRFQGLRPKTIVEYIREPFTFAPGNVRVTLDYHIRTGLNGTDFLNPDCILIPAGDAPAILEVKWDAFLPSVIRDLVQLDGRRTSSFSKYAACRRYG